MEYRQTRTISGKGTKPDQFAEALRGITLDAAGRLVEGARTNVIVATGGGDLRTPPLARGCVAGIARAIALERIPALREGDIAEDDLWTASEIVAVNAVRGARPIATLDRRPVGGSGHPFHAQIARALERG